ncbi:fatty acid desaturase [Malikia granosa]|uniref:Fatty acid desaturase n=1 Tax=Malikia granosa TaxID=263067 RepID=A0A2S9K130_9BURK|nr:fatty acid desaturase [Malikia granosa]PRD64129.1 fatty acid desaturase [Malikia granosa]
MPDQNPTAAPWRRSRADYRLIGGAAERAHAAGLVNAQWYQSPLPRPALKALMKRDDAHAIRDTLLWYALILASAALFVHGWTSGWSAGGLLAAYFLYATLYSSPADSRWHESSHGTAFRTRWMNDLLYQFASFQVWRRPTRWRWSHARHHSDTLVTGRDPEFNVTLPPCIPTLLLNLFGLRSVPRELAAVLRNAAGSIDAEEKTYVPEMEWPAMVREARRWLLVLALAVGVAVWLQSWLPLLLLGMAPTMLGAWLQHVLGLTQHAGLPENTLDHRLNSRTILMNPVLRFLYWNMNYHVEHHMYPLVPYHALPALHEQVKADCPPPYPGLAQALAEILPTLLQQTRDSGHSVSRPLPQATQ